MNYLAVRIGRQNILRGRSVKLWVVLGAALVLLLRSTSDTLCLSAKDREIVQDIFADTVVYWRQRKKPFWIFSPE